MRFSAYDFIKMPSQSVIAIQRNFSNDAHQNCAHKQTLWSKEALVTLNFRVKYVSLKLRDVTIPPLQVPTLHPHIHLHWSSNLCSKKSRIQLHSPSLHSSPTHHLLQHSPASTGQQLKGPVCKIEKHLMVNKQIPIYLPCSPNRDFNLGKVNLMLIPVFQCRLSHFCFILLGYGIFDDEGWHLISFLCKWWCQG